MVDSARSLRLLLTLGRSTGGVGRHVHTLASELATRGHDVAVCAPSSTQDTFDWSATGARFVAAPVGAVAPAAAVQAARTLRRLAADADVVHAHGARAGATAARARVRPLVITWHNAPAGTLRRRVGLRILERVAARGASVTLAASQDLAHRARAAGARDVRFAPVSVAPLPEPNRSRAEMRTTLGVGERPVVLAIARLAKQKRLDLLVEASRGWATEPDTPVVLVAGEGRYRQELAAAAAAANSSMRLLGHRSDIAELLAAADVVALTSDWEARPLVAQEALRAGVPLVATEVGGVADLVGDAAVLVPRGDAAAFRSALIRLAADPDERSRLGSLGREQAASWPTVQETVDELIGLYIDLCSR